MTRREAIRSVALPGAGKNSGALLKTRRALGLRFLFSTFSPEKVNRHVHDAEMKDTARCPDGSRAPRAPLVSRETQGTLSPLSFDGQNETRVPPGTLRSHLTPKPVPKRGFPDFDSISPFGECPIFPGPDCCESNFCCHYENLTQPFGHRKKLGIRRTAKSNQNRGTPSLGQVLA